jgi:hypothetical protein
MSVVCLGFVELYFTQATEEPHSVWEELSKLGYDLHLDWSCYSTDKEALDAMLKWGTSLLSSFHSLLPFDFSFNVSFRK